MFSFIQTCDNMIFVRTIIAVVLFDVVLIALLEVSRRVLGEMMSSVQIKNQKQKMLQETTNEIDLNAI